MIRKSSYYVNIPGSIRVSVKGNNPSLLLIKGPLGKVALEISSPCKFYIEKSYLNWTRIIGYSTRNDLFQRILNNNIKKMLSNVFFRLSIPDSSSFKLIGRGYKILWSKSFRLIHLELGFTQKKVIPLPSAVNLKIQDRYNFSFTSLNSFELRVLSNNIRSLRKPNSYTGKGILLNNENIILKQGKKTQY